MAQDQKISASPKPPPLFPTPATCHKPWEKLNRGVSKPGGFPLFSGKVQIVSQTLSGLFLVGAVNRPRKRKRINRENPRTIPEQIGKIPEKSGKSQKGYKKDRKRTKRNKKGQKRTKKSRSGKPPRLKPPLWRPLKTAKSVTIVVPNPQHQTKNNKGTVSASQRLSRVLASALFFFCLWGRGLFCLFPLACTP